MEVQVKVDCWSESKNIVVNQHIFIYFILKPDSKLDPISNNLLKHKSSHKSETCANFMNKIRTLP